MKELWKQLDDYPNYAVSNFGNIKNIAKNRIRKQCVALGGYKGIQLGNKKNRKSLYIHRLVAKYFIPNNDIEKKYINHKDGNKINNHADNLEWCTNSYNIRHAFRLGLNKGNCKYNQEKIAIKLNDLKHLSTKEISNITGLSYKYINQYYIRHAIDDYKKEKHSTISYEIIIKNNISGYLHATKSKRKFEEMFCVERHYINLGKIVDKNYEIINIEKPLVNKYDRRN